MSDAKKETFVIDFQSEKARAKMKFHIEGTRIRGKLTPGKKKAFCLKPDEYVLDIVIKKKRYKYWVIIAPSKDPVIFHCIQGKVNTITIEQSAYSEKIAAKRKHENEVINTAPYYLPDDGEFDVSNGFLIGATIHATIGILVIFIILYSNYQSGQTLYEFFFNDSNDTISIEKNANPKEKIIEETSIEKSVTEKEPLKEVTIGDLESRTCSEAKDVLDSKGFTNYKIYDEATDLLVDIGSYDNYVIVKQFQSPTSLFSPDTEIKLYAKSSAKLKKEAAFENAAVDYYDELMQKKNLGFEECWEASEYENKGKTVFPETYILLNKADNLMLIVHNQKYDFNYMITSDNYESWNNYDGISLHSDLYQYNTIAENVIIRQTFKQKRGMLKGVSYNSMSEEKLEEIVNRVVFLIEKSESKASYFGTVLEAKEYLESNVSNE